MSTDDIVLVKNLPPSLAGEVHRDIREFTIAFINHDENDPRATPSLLGSGVLVSANGVRAILTAKHVLDVLPKNRRLCVLLEKTNHPHSLDLGGLTFLEIAKATGDPFAGPDLAAVVLAPSVAGTIAAKRIFYNLDSRRESVLGNPQALDNGVWMTQGYVAERTVVTHDHDGLGKTTGFYQFGGLGGPDQIIQREGFDYFEFPIDVEVSEEDVPGDWGGMSGGGVWQVALKRDGETIIHKHPVLSGVMFHQTMASKRAISIKAHGRRSVYDAAYEAISKSSSR